MSLEGISRLASTVGTQISSLTAKVADKFMTSAPSNTQGPQPSGGVKPSSNQKPVLLTQTAGANQKSLTAIVKGIVSSILGHPQNSAAKQKQIDKFMKNENFTTEKLKMNDLANDRYYVHSEKQNKFFIVTKYKQVYEVKFLDNGQMQLHDAKNNRTTPPFSDLDNVGWTKEGPIDHGHVDEAPQQAAVNTSPKSISQTPLKSMNDFQQHPNYKRGMILSKGMETVKEGTPLLIRNPDLSNGGYIISKIKDKIVVNSVVFNEGSVQVRKVVVDEKGSINGYYPPQNHPEVRI